MGDHRGSPGAVYSFIYFVREHISHHAHTKTLCHFAQGFSIYEEKQINIQKENVITHILKPLCHFAKGFPFTKIRKKIRRRNVTTHILKTLCHFAKRFPSTKRKQSRTKKHKNNISFAQVFSIFIYNSIFTTSYHVHRHLSFFPRLTYACSLPSSSSSSSTIPTLTYSTIDHRVHAWHHLCIVIFPIRPLITCSIYLAHEAINTLPFSQSLFIFHFAAVKPKSFFACWLPSKRLCKKKHKSFRDTLQKIHKSFFETLCEKKTKSFRNTLQKKTQVFFANPSQPSPSFHKRKQEAFDLFMFVYIV